MRFYILKTGFMKSCYADWRSKIGLEEQDWIGGARLDWRSKIANIFSIKRSRNAWALLYTQTKRFKVKILLHPNVKQDWKALFLTCYADWRSAFHHLLFFTLILGPFLPEFLGSYDSSSSSECRSLEISQNSLEPNLNGPCCCALYQKICSCSLLDFALLLITKHSKFSVHWSITW